MIPKPKKPPVGISLLGKSSNKLLVSDKKKKRRLINKKYPRMKINMHGNFISFYRWDGNKIGENRVDLKLLRRSLEASVRKRLMAEVPYGVLLSGGLDSSLIASIAVRETQKITSGTIQADEPRYDESK